MSAHKEPPKRRKRRKNDLRTQRLTIRVSPREQVCLELEARHYGLTVAAYVMALALGTQGVADSETSVAYLKPGPGQCVTWDENKKKWVLVENQSLF